MEVWKDIIDYEGLYQVSNLGRVKSVDRIVNNDKKKYKLKGILLSKCISKKGYYIVSLCKNSKSKTFLVHRLVSNAFIKNNLNKPCVNHIDGVKTNNKVSNLEWCTYKENTQHALKNKLMNINHMYVINKKSYKDVYILYKKEVLSQREIAERYNVNQSTICRIIKKLNYQELNNLKP